MRIKRKKRDNILVLTVAEKRLDANNASHFKSAIQRLVNGDVRGLVVDISDVDFIDSTGLGAIVKGLKLMDQNTAVAVCGVREPILTMFKLTRMDKVMKIVNTEAEAIEYVEASPA